MKNLETIKNKKFLLIGSNFPYSIEKSYLRSFQNLNIKKVSFFSPDNNVILKMINIVNNKIIREFYYYLYRLFLTKFLTTSIHFDYIIVFKGIELNLDTLKILSRFQKKAKWINIYTDNPFNLKFPSCSNTEVVKSMSFYDYFCTSFSKKLKKKLKKNNVKKHIFLPFGYDKKIHFTKQKLKKKLIRNDVNFVGAYDEFRKNFLNNLNRKIDIFGPGWNRAKDLNKFLKIKSNFINGKRLREIYRNYAVSLNILREQDKESHNMKVFEIPIMGGLMLTQRNKESKYFFLENKECFMYSNQNEAKSKIDLILKKKINYSIFEEQVY
ncbi:glycosyltransferase [Candidatus Pelagibacter bacterium nBUS_44]|uniref:glycosyltransferase family protein n=1 Tax=Candidatus Pelagibacter bacterium nBUS_44 TaxID=3374195 RepID=UPI003EBAEA06